MNRRELLVSGGAVLASSFLFGSGLRAQTGGKREEIRTFSASPEKVASLRRAFQELRARPPAAPVGWFNYAAVHRVAPNDPLASGLEPALGAYWNQCHRDERLFFLWHRAYLRAFELNLQLLANDGTLRLPYWDWHSDSTLPEIFRSETLAGGEQNWLFNPRRSQEANDGVALLDGSSGAIDKDDFSFFQSLLNGSEHSDIHVAVGGSGDMRKQSTAARDPIFWLHHCNIDRLLAAWVDRTPRMIPDQSGAWQDGRYKFPIDGAADFSPAAGDLAPDSVTPFGQAYESLSAPFTLPPQRSVTRPPVRARAGIAPRRMRNNLFALNAPLEVALPARGGSIALSVAERPRLNIQRFMSRDAVPAADPAAPPQTVRIVLEDVRLANPPENLLGYDVYLNLDDGTGVPQPDAKIGAIGLFNLSEGAHDQHGEEGARTGGQTLTFDAPPNPGRQGPLSQIFTVSLVPRFVRGSAGEADQSGLVIADVRAEVSGAALR